MILIIFGKAKSFNGKKQRIIELTTIKSFIAEQKLQGAKIEIL